MVAFPIVKLAYLGIKQGSKFIANGLKARAKQSPFFKKYVCMPPAQLYHAFDVKVRLQMLGLGKPTHVEKLSETMAAELGAELLGEVIIYGTGVFILYLEYSRSAANEGIKEQQMLQKDIELELRLQEQGMLVEQMSAQIRELERTVGDLDSRNTSLSAKLFGKSKS